jgi:tetratricopeptide (TPR) repeat protein
VLFPLGDAAASLRSQTLALETAQSAGWLLAEARALSGIADAHFIAGRMHTARDWFVRAERSAKAAGDLELELSSQGMQAVIDVMARKVRASKVACAGLLERCRAAGLFRSEVLLEANIAWASLLLGELPDAREHAARAVGLAARIGAQRFEALALAYGAIARTTLEPECSVERELDRAMKLAEATGIGFAGGAVYAALLSAERRPERVRALLHDAERVMALRTMNFSRLILVHQGTIAALRAGDPAAADRYAEHLRASCSEEPHELGAILVDFGRCLSAWSRGEQSCELRADLTALRERLVRAELQPALAYFDEVVQP